MAGHSKWANIKHRKEGADKRRGILFSKLSKELMVAARIGGIDTQANHRLRIAVSRARSYNMPKDTIERAIKKGSGDLGVQHYEDLCYEAYLSGSVGLLAFGLTDKKSRSTPEIKNILKKYGASLAEKNAVLRLFTRQSFFALDRSLIDEESLYDRVLSAGVEDIRETEQAWELVAGEQSYSLILESLEQAQLSVLDSGIYYLPLAGTSIELSLASHSQTITGIQNLIETLEDHEDIQEVYTNMEIIS